MLQKYNSAASGNYILQFNLSTLMKEVKIINDAFIISKQLSQLESGSAV